MHALVGTGPKPASRAAKKISRHLLKLSPYLILELLCGDAVTPSPALKAREARMDKSDLMFRLMVSDKFVIFSEA
jgi:hypothetical protein